MEKITFKALRSKVRGTEWRALSKRGALALDMNSSADSIMIDVSEMRGVIIIDCDGNTGEFTLKFPWA